MKIIFTDLDATLLDHGTYSYAPAESALRKIRAGGIPLIICTSKTYAETIFWRRELSNKHPFIVENGAAICIPRGYFGAEYAFGRARDGYDVIEFGIPSKKIISALEEFRRRGLQFTGMSELSEDEVAQMTNLPPGQARLAKQREYGEPIIMDLRQERKLKTLADEKGLRVVKGGRFYHILGNNDKGKAAQALIAIYKKEFGEVRAIAFGDSPNDFEMLKVADSPFLVQRSDGSYASNDFLKAEGIGPRGWNKKVLELLR